MTSNYYNTIGNDGIIFIESNDSLDKLVMNVYNVSYTHLGFYYLDSINNEEKISIFIFDIISGLNPSWLNSYNLSFDTLYQNQNIKNISIMRLNSNDNINYRFVIRLMIKGINEFNNDGDKRNYIKSNLFEKLFNLENICNNYNNECLFPLGYLLMIKILLIYLGYSNLTFSYHDDFTRLISSLIIFSPMTIIKNINSDSNIQNNQMFILNSLSSKIKYDKSKLLVPFESLNTLYKNSIQNGVMNISEYNNQVSICNQVLSTNKLTDNRITNDYKKVIVINDNYNNFEILKGTVQSMDSLINNISCQINHKQDLIINVNDLIEISNNLKYIFNVDNNEICVGYHNYDNYQYPAIVINNYDKLFINNVQLSLTNPHLNQFDKNQLINFLNYIDTLTQYDIKLINQLKLIIINRLSQLK